MTIARANRHGLTGGSFTMWTRSLLKTNAKEALRGRYWRSFLLCLLLSFLGIGDVSTNVVVQVRENIDSLDRPINGEVWQGNVTAQDVLSELPSYLSPMILNFVGIAVVIGIIVGLCWSAFLINPLAIGRNRYFMESRQSPSPMGTVTTVFGPGYLNLVKVQLLTHLKIFLGYFLIIPGIYWDYCYAMVPYLLAENPYLTTRRAMELSKQMMDGEKWNTFVLQLSFFGWAILCVLTFGIGYLFLEPYIQATFSELYAALRAKALAAGMSDERELGGFVRH